MTLCYVLAEASKDENTKLGAVVIGAEGDLQSTGWNGFPRGLVDDIPERQVSPEKYFWFVHAEQNAILNAGRQGVILKGSTLYCTAFPCHNCAQSIIQAGIAKVIYDVVLGGVWNDSMSRAKEMLSEAGVVVRKHHDGYVIPQSRISGKTKELK